MPVLSEWFSVDQTILFIKYDGRWTLDDYYANFQIANDMIRGVEHPVVTIIDFSSSGPLPLRFLTVGGHAERNRAGNSLQIIIFGLSGYMETIARTFTRIFPQASQGMRVVSSREEAIEQAQAVLEADTAG